MDPRKWKRVKELFGKALELQPRRREEFLEKACQGDTELYDEVCSLLATDALPDSPADAAIAGSLEAVAGGSLRGKLVEQYEILEHLDSGGMGDIYLAYDTRLRRKAALKFLPRHLASSAPIRSRFLREARAAASLKHPNVVTIYEVSEFGDLPFIAMEFLQGRPLRDIVALGPMEIQRVIQITEGICAGLYVAHLAGVIHRDIKPENIIVCDDGCAKILDFGIAKTRDATRLTKPGSPIGTANYMSPEQGRGEEVDHRTDIFSVGVVIYEMLTGQPPFERGSVAATVKATAADEPRSIVELRPDVPGYLWDVVRRALQKEKTHRYQLISDLASDLDRRGTMVPVPPTTSPVVHSVAVLPFRVAADDKEIEYLANGICEDIITHLAKLEQLRVASRTAAFRFRDASSDPAEIARELGVQHLLDGSIRKHREKIRINVQLIAIDEGAVVWSETYDRTLADILDLQSELAEQVVTALNLTLGGKEKYLVERTPTTKPDAYDCYLRGRYYSKRRDQASLEKAMELFAEAARLDSDFAEAHAQLVISHYLHENYGYGQLPDLPKKALQLANRAVDLQPGSVDAHLALFLAVRREDLRRGITELRTAVALDPTNSEAHHYLAHAYVMFGRYLRAARHERVALRHDPFQDVSRAHLCRIHHFLNLPEQATIELQALFKEERSESLAWLTKGWIAWCQRDWEAALQALEAALGLDPNNVYVLYYLADCYSRTGERETAVNLLVNGLERLPGFCTLHQRLGQVYRLTGEMDLAAEQFASAHRLIDASCSEAARSGSVVYQNDKAVVLALEGRVEEAIYHIETGAAAGLGHYADLDTRPDWDNLRTSPRFKEILAAMKKSTERDFPALAAD